MTVLVNTSISGVGGLHAFYAKSANKLYLHSDNNVVQLGGFAPGSAHTIENSQGTLDCAATTVTTNGNDITINWSFIPKSGFFGQKNVYGGVVSGSDTINTIKLGTWTITSTTNALNLGLSPYSGSSNRDVARFLSVTYTNNSGVSDFSQMKVKVGASVTGTNGIYATYIKSQNKLYLYDTDGVTLLGGFAPGSTSTLQNSQVRLRCDVTTVTTSGNDVVINWCFLPKATMAGQQNVYGYVEDGTLTQGWDLLGTWNILNNTPPVNVSVSPASGSSAVGVGRDLSVTYRDVDGPDDFSRMSVLVNTSTAGANALSASYTKIDNKLYLVNDSGGGLLGGFIAGSNNVIENSQGKLDCAATTVTITGNDVVIKWRFIPKNSFVGQKNVYASSIAGGSNVGPTQLGSWTITSNSAPVLGTVNPNSLNSNIGVAKTITTNYSDVDGASDLTQVSLLINSSVTTANSLTAIYDRVSNKLYLFENDGMTLTGGYAPGSVHIIANSQGALDCANTSVSITGNDLAVTWSLTPSSTFIGLKKLYLHAVDSIPTNVGYSDQGDWLITTPSNSAPAATSDDVTTTEDAVVTGTVTGTDIDEDELTFAVTTEPAHGMLALSPNGNFTYTPGTNYNGSDSFGFKASDGNLDSSPATISITVTPVNDVPATEDATFTTEVNTAVETPLVATDADGDTLTYEVVTQPEHGALSGTAPALTYTPNTNYNGEDSFTFKVNDGTVDSAISTVHLLVGEVGSPENSAPVAEGDVFEIPENEVLTGQLRATDADGDLLTFSLVYDAEEGHVVVNPDGSFVYTPAPHSAYFYDPFAFKVSDGVSESEITWVFVDITDVNEAPEAYDGSVTTTQNMPVPFTLDAYDFDYEPLEYTVLTAPVHGSISTLEEGFLYEPPVLTYIPAADFSGTDTLTFKVSDGLYESQTKTVTFTVEAAPSDSSPGFDALIRQGVAGSFIGNDIYNATASGQTLSQGLASSTTTSYELQIQNEDSVARSFTVTGSAGGSDWSPRYYDAATGGTEITTAVRSATGWTTPVIESDESFTLRVELPTLQLLSSEEGAGDKEVLVSVRDADDTEGSVDAVKAVIHYQPAYRPDAKITVGQDTIYPWDIMGNNIYLPNGDDSNHQDQTVLQTKGSSAPAPYFVYAQNDGVSPDHLIVSGPAGISDWSVQYFDALTGGQDITADVTGTGWVTPELAAGETYAIRVEVTSHLSTSFVTPFTLAVKVDSQSASNLSALSDVVKAITTRERLDLSIYAFADDKPVLPGAGAGINNIDGQNQVVTQPTYSGRPANFLVGSLYAEFTGTYRYTAPAGDADWTIRYFYGSQEITDEITGAGWEHEITGGGLTNSNSDLDEYFIQDPIRVEVTPLSTVGLAADKTLLIKATALNETEAIDVVKAVIHREPALDATIRPVYNDQSPDDYVYTGLGIHNADATNQTVGFSQVEGQSNVAKFQIEVRNHGNVADTFVLKAPASESGWLLHYFDAAQDGTEITTDLTSTAGWTTPSVEPGEVITVRLEASPDPNVTGALASSALIQATSVLDPTAMEAVKGTYGFQRIAKLQYTLNQGVTWTDAPLAASGEVIPGLAKHVVGVRAIRLDPSVPWPFEPDIKPAWDHATFWHVGETIWIQCGAPSEELKPIQAECGDIIITNLKVVEAYQVSLSPSKTYVPLDGGEVSLAAKVTKSNGQPAVGVTVRFSAKFEEGGATAGEIGGPGIGDDIAVTDANGVATVTLATGSQVGAVAVQAVLQHSGTDTTFQDDQEVIFGLPQVEPVEPTDE